MWHSSSSYCPDSYRMVLTAFNDYIEESLNGESGLYIEGAGSGILLSLKDYSLFDVESWQLIHSEVQQTLKHFGLYSVERIYGRLFFELYGVRAEVTIGCLNTEGITSILYKNLALKNQRYYCGRTSEIIHWLESESLVERLILDKLVHCLSQSLLSKVLKLEDKPLAA